MMAYDQQLADAYAVVARQATEIERLRAALTQIVCISDDNANAQHEREVACKALGQVPRATANKPEYPTVIPRSNNNETGSP
jgi:hypothetical protein